MRSFSKKGILFLSLCLMCIIIIAIFTVLVIVFFPKRPNVQVLDVDYEDSKYNLTLQTMDAHLEMKIQLKNPNRFEAIITKIRMTLSYITPNESIIPLGPIRNENEIVLKPEKEKIFSLYFSKFYSMEDNPALMQELQLDYETNSDSELQIEGYVVFQVMGQDIKVDNIQYSFFVPFV